MGVWQILATPGGAVVTQPAIDVRDVSLAYRISSDRAGTLKEFAIQTVRGQGKHSEFMAVRNVSFEVHPGEVLGVIGPNGAGKSTLMKMVARVLPPTSGRIIVRGNVAPLIELGAGFNPELDAEENIRLYGALLGRGAWHMGTRVDAICEWAGLSEFKDAPIRTYSSGMLARLGFAVAVDIQPEVLVVDEVLAVGDAAFQQKSKDKMFTLISGGASVLFVSHDLVTVEEISTRVLWLDHGAPRMLGGPSEVIEAYSETFSQEQPNRGID